MRTLLLFGIVLLTGCAGTRFVVDIVSADQQLTETEIYEDDDAGSAKVALIDVRGQLLNARRNQLIGEGENPVARFVESLQLAEENSYTKAVVVRINSPGGTVTASDIMYRELVDFKQRTGKPVVVLMSDLAASGGYYLACGGDEIIAHPTTITGSIGVIMQTFSVADGLARIGIHTEAITSGPNKAIANPLEPLQESHQEILQGIVNEFYRGFVEIVKTNRPSLDESDLGWVTDGRVVTGKQAAEIGLVDGLGDLRSAFASAKSRANLENATLVKYHRPLEYVASPHAQSEITPREINLMQINIAADPLLDQTGFYYLWNPSDWK